MLKRTLKLPLWGLSVQINLGCRANKWEKEVCAPWDGVFLFLSLWLKDKKSEKQKLAPFSNFLVPKGQFAHIILALTLMQGKRFVNWTTLFPTWCSHSDFNSALLLPSNEYCQPKGALWLIRNDFPRQSHILVAKTHLWAGFYMYCSLKSSLDHISSVWWKMKLMWEPLTNLQEMILKFTKLYCIALL